MFEENEKPVIDEITENVEEQATEELVDGAVSDDIDEQSDIERTEEPQKLYTEKDFNKKLDEVLAKKIARKEEKIRKEYEKKYGRLENVLKVGMEDDNVDSITETLEDFYTKKGKQIPSMSQVSQRDMEYLAERDANEIIESGYDEITEELNRLSEIGIDKMSQSEKVIFLKLKKAADKIDFVNELKSIGVNELPEDFQDFSKKLNPELSVKEKYEMYTKLKPKKEVKTIGSMKNTDTNNKGVKQFYTYEEASKFTRADFDKNPELFNAVCDSMTKWK